MRRFRRMKMNSIKTVGLVIADTDEYVHIENAFPNATNKSVKGLKGHTVSIDTSSGTVTLRTVCSGIGKVNAAVCTQILIDRFGADVIINTGVAGSLDAKIDIGDMVVSTDLVEHDMDTTAFGDPLGQVPRIDTFSFPADVELVKKAVLANEEANPDIKTFTGRIVSGDQFVSSPDVKDKLVENFGAKCTEMEGAAIAHVAYLNKVSCVIIRAISDKADNSASMDYPSFEKKAIEHSLRLVRNLLPRI